MAKEGNEKPFKIHGIELITFSIQPQPAREYSNDVFEFTIHQEQKTNADKRLVIIFTTITIKESEKEMLAHLQVACGFEIPSFESVIRKNKDGDYLIPHELNAAINRISIATSRGILYSQVRGSYLQNSTLPVLPIE